VPTAAKAEATTTTATTTPRRRGRWRFTARCIGGSPHGGHPTSLERCRGFTRPGDAASPIRGRASRRSLEHDRYEEPCPHRPRAIRRCHDKPVTRRVESWRPRLELRYARPADRATRR
jgi:hypothetical protein